MLIHQLKLYPNQSQGGVYGSGGGSAGGATGPSDVLPNGYGYTPGGEYQDAQGNDYVGAWHSHVDGTIAKGNMHTNISNEDLLFPIVTNNPNTGLQDTTQNSGGPNLNNPTPLNITPPPTPPPPTNNAGPLSLDPPRSVPPPVTNPSIYQAPPFVATNIQQEYIEKGLTFKSNNKFVNQRNEAGNLIFEENSENNQNLIIEPTIETYTNKSFIDAVDTQFNYFKFPARIGIDSTLDLTFDADFNIEDSGVDPVSGFYVINPETEQDYIPMNVSYNPPPSGYEEGLKIIPFDKTLGGVSIDADLNAVVLTPEKIKYVREGNKAIKFTISYVGVNDPGNNNDTGYVLGLSRNMPTFWRGWPSNAGTLYRGLPRGYNKTGNNPAVINGSKDHNDVYVPVQLIYVIDPDDMFDYDQYQAKQITGGPANYIRKTADWRIELIDDPGPGGYGKQ